MFPRQSVWASGKRSSIMGQSSRSVMNEQINMCHRITSWSAALHFTFHRTGAAAHAGTAGPLMRHMLNHLIGQRSPR